MTKTRKRLCKQVLRKIKTKRKERKEYTEIVIMTKWRAAHVFNPFTARVLDRVLWGDSNFWVCGWNPMMWPFKWKLSACTYTWCYLFFKISQNEIWTFGWNLLLAKFGSERVKEVLKTNSNPYISIPCNSTLSFFFFSLLPSLCKQSTGCS